MLNKLADTIPLKTNSKIPTMNNNNNNNTGIVVSKKESFNSNRAFSLTMINRNKLNENNNYQGNNPTKTSNEPSICVINLSYFP